MNKTTLISANSHSMIRLFSTIVLFVALCLGVSLFSTNAQAQDSGYMDDYPWEVNIGFGYAGNVDADWAHDSYSTHIDPGFTFMGSIGYRFSHWFSLNLEQSFIRGYERNDIKNNENDEDAYWNYGQTALTWKLIYRSDENDLDLYFKMGVGMNYGTEYERGDEDGVFNCTIPLGIGANKYFSEWFGVGLDVQYDIEVMGDYIGQLKAMVHLAVRF